MEKERAGMSVKKEKLLISFYRNDIAPSNIFYPRLQFPNETHHRYHSHPVTDPKQVTLRYTYSSAKL